MNKPSFFYWDDRKLIKIQLDDILLIKTEGNYIRFYAMEFSYMVRTSLDKALAVLPENLFIRTHKCFAVAAAHLVEVDRDEVKVGNVNVPISKYYYPKVISILNIIGR